MISCRNKLLKTPEKNESIETIRARDKFMTSIILLKLGYRNFSC